MNSKTVEARKKFSTLAIHAGQSPDPATGAIMTPVYLTSTYVQEAPEKHKGFDYSRSNHPTRLALEKNLAALEGAEYGLAFGSGMAAISTLALSLNPGDHVVCGKDVYGGTYRVFTKVFQRFGIGSAELFPSAASLADSQGSPRLPSLHGVLEGRSHVADLFQRFPRELGELLGALGKNLFAKS